MPLENTILSFDESTDSTFTCSATGIPAPTITFYIVFANGSRVPLSSLSEPRLTISMPNQTDDYQHSTISMSNQTDDYQHSTTSMSNQTDDYQHSGIYGVAPLVSRTLMLAGFEDDDSGIYSCEATNGVGNASRDVDLLVRSMLLCMCRKKKVDI